MDIQDIEAKLERLRKDYLEHPLKRSIIVRQARALQIAKELQKQSLNQ